MAVRYELVWAGADGADRAVPVTGTMVIGRGARNDIVLSEDEVSWEHARVWEENGTLFLKDAGSTNGTFVDERRVTDRTAIQPGSTVRFGTRFEMRVLQQEGAAVVDEPTWILEDLSTGIRRPLALSLTVGDVPNADLKISGVPPVVFSVDDGQITLQDASGTRPLRAGEIIDLKGAQLRLLEQRRQTPMRTARPTWEEGHYHVDATLDGRSPTARVHDDNGNSLVVEGETRATLLYVLAKAVVDHRRAGLPTEKQGWLDDMDAVTQVWGRTDQSEVSNRLSVVVYRLRAGLKSVDLSSDFVERSRGRVRIRAARISLG